MLTQTSRLTEEIASISSLVRIYVNLDPTEEFMSTQTVTKFLFIYFNSDHTNESMPTQKNPIYVNSDLTEDYMSTQTPQKDLCTLTL